MSNPKPVYTIQMDGDAWCATNADFENLQESIAGFGSNPQKALEELLVAEYTAEEERRTKIREWHCSNCDRHFSLRTSHDAAPCPECKCGKQYVSERGR